LTGSDVARAIAAVALCVAVSWLWLGLDRAQTMPLRGFELRTTETLVGERPLQGELQSIDPLKARGEPVLVGLNFAGQSIATTGSTLALEPPAAGVQLLAQCTLAGAFFLSEPIVGARQPWSAIRWRALNAAADPSCLQQRIASLSVRHERTLILSTLRFEGGTFATSVLPMSALPGGWLATRDALWRAAPSTPINPPLSPLALKLWVAVALIALISLVALSPQTKQPVATAGNAWAEAAAGTALGLLVLGALAVANGGLNPSDAAAILRYLAFVPIQQILLLMALPKLLERLGGTAPAPLTLGLCFALLHSPNAELMLLTLLAGTGWAFLYRRNRRLVPLIASHALLGIAASMIDSGPWLRSLETGTRYLGFP
jgi:membrane protease YdiL (CAAX protease family)